MRILAVIDTIQVSGPARQLIAIIPTLQKRGVSVRVACFHRQGRPPSPFVDLLQSTGIDHVVINEHRRFDVMAAWRLAHHAIAWDADLVQTHGYKPSAIAFLMKALRRRPPWIAFFHGATTENLKVRLFHWLDQLLMRFSSLMVVMSAAHKAAAPPGVPSAILYNAVLQPPHAEAFERRRRFSEHVPARYCVIGRLSSEKGVDVFLDACHIMRRQGIAFNADIVGDGPDRALLERQAAEAGLSGVVRFIGHVQDPEPYFLANDVLVIPSRSEGLPNVLLEGLRAGMPVVATPVGAIPEVLTSSQAGVLVPVGDAPALAGAMLACATEAYMADGLADRLSITRTFSLDARASRLAQLYDEVLAREPRRPR